MKTMGIIFNNIFYFFAFTFFVNSSFSAIKTNRTDVKSKIESQKFDEKFYLKSAQSALKQFQVDTFKNSDLDLDLIFLKIEKKVVYQDVKQNQTIYFEFQNLTNAVVKFVGQLKNSYKLPVDPKLRSSMQMNFYGLSQAIKKANQMNLTIQSEQFEKLHDILMSQSTNLFYASYKERRKVDLFWCAYFLHELNYPMDLTAKHITALESSISKLNQPEKYKRYGAKLAKLSLCFGEQLAKPNQGQIDILFKWAQFETLTDTDFQSLQKAYLKQLQLFGDSEKIKDFKKELATSLLYQESKNLFRHPLNILKYIQFLIGYIFVAWPLEVILIVGSLIIFAFQASSVLTFEEKTKAKRIDKKLWMMFTKSYLGVNVPFFSKLAASLILFGVGLYFNSAKNFVESLISSL